MVYKFNVGDELFIKSRYEGVQKVTVVSQVNYGGGPCYELDRLVIMGKDGNTVGSKEFIEEEAEYIFPACRNVPCPEHLLLK